MWEWPGDDANFYQAACKKASTTPAWGGLVNDQWYAESRCDRASTWPLVRTDRSALKWLQSFQEPEGQVVRWVERLAEFDIKVEHHPGVQHTNADALSHQSCSQCGQTFGEEPRDDPPHVALISLFLQWTQEGILAMQQSDPDLKQMMEWLGTNTMPCECQLNKIQTLQSIRHKGNGCNWKARSSSIYGKM